MAILPLNLYTAAQVRELDRRTIEEFGIPGATLMERAGKASLEQLRTHWPQAQRLVIVCGVGNNGGDGYVLARLARKAEMYVSIYQLGDDSKLGPDAQAARQMLLDSGMEILPFQPQALRSADVVIDAIFGTGLSRGVTGQWAEAIEAINACGQPVFAMDIPSGLHADTGNILGVAIQAHVTATFGGLKQGMFTYLGPDYCGEITFDSLSIPPEAYHGVAPSARRIILEDHITKLPSRAKAGHKGDYGHVVIIGGERGMPGAARMAGEAAYRVGAGLVSIATREKHASLLNLARPELMCYGVESAEELKLLLNKATTIVVGPGLGQDLWGQTMLAEALNHSHPLVVDADALNLLASQPHQHNRWIMTPHPGEASRLLNINIEEIQADRFAAVQALQQRYGGVAVLKGNGSLVCATNHPLGLCTAGNPGMASGGMGDVLSGAIAGLLAQGLTLSDAAHLGVTIHAMAGDRAAREGGERGLLAGDLMEHLRRLANLQQMGQ
ncbi:bifunctional ADP-dependent NAD(P)H-hydrate dehydratase/NAD(P)H-hydrate epimerase [Nitrosococcus watsonii]|uniref:Bifunctional NAD(P)H-hydrate repair enzyme n=1 Tax=Nitrosococcus watsoni (strain C-113) TaxID=105559 RepID=D8KAV5_NITWC|nr:bifunctional ADP-dependent NAD(P)H-hydrate dehydratase/NAD(P)H-hydrate epimerase [Nitrosococcus watsonii]ADJ29532.1 carbohydrate kinase, YjeF related protein [Nitrosococcus watsonii C-113]